MRNVGKVSRRWLREVGIESVRDLKTYGAASTYRMVKAMQPQASLNLLWALEGAIADKDWRNITSERKQELLRELTS